MSNESPMTKPDQKSVLQDRINAKMDALALWHRKIALFSVIDRMPSSRLFILIALLLGLAAGFANYQIRQAQYDVWQSKKEITFLGDTPLFSTTDASYFLNLARQYHETGDVLDFNKKRLYPYYAQQAEKEPAQDSVFDFPLFSVLIASFSENSTTESLLKTGNGLIPILGFVMALGILLAFGASGFWLEGAVAAIGAGLAPTFLMRSSIGRIDTDILNLGFFYAVLGLTIFAGRAKDWRVAIGWVIAAGLMLNLFFWWYDTSEFGWAFTVGLVWLSAVTSRSWQRPLVLSALFLLVSGLAFKSIGLSSDSSYFKDVINTGVLVFPNTFSTITELRVVPFEQILTSITDSYGLGLIGVLGLALFAVRHPVLAVVYGPASIFALANFLVGNRAIFYSAPMIWFGAAFLAVMMARFAWGYAPKALVRLRHGELSVIAVITAMMMGGIYHVDRVQNYVPNPSFPKEVMRGFAAAKGNLPTDSVVATWWDYGYASTLFNGYNTLHDGGAQTFPVTHYVARALVAQSQQESHAIFKNLASTGLQGIIDNSATHEGAEAHITGANYDSKSPVFLVLTEQMGEWMGSISNLGMWDTKAGEAINAQYSPYGPTLFYNELLCQAGERGDAPVCDGNVFDLGVGTINGQVAIRQVTQAEDGKISVRTPLQEKGYNAIHIANLSGKGTRLLMAHNRLAQSTFHRLFHLAEVEDELFQLVYDDYPYVRIYALK